MLSKDIKRQKLQTRYKSHQKELYKDLNISSNRVVEYGKNMAVLGGVLFVGYTVLDRLLNAKLKTGQKKEEPSRYEALNKILLPILAAGLQQGSVVLLKRAKDLLIDYLEEKAEND